MFQPMKRPPSSMPGFDMPEIAPFNQSLNIAPKAKGGMFASDGFKKGMGVVADMLAAAAAAQGAPHVFNARQAYKQQQADEEEYQRRQADGWDRWVKEQQYKLANPEPNQPTQTDRYLAELQDPNTPVQRKRMLAQILFPPVIGTVNGSSAMIDRGAMLVGGQQAPAPQGGDDEWEYSDGGAGSPAPRPFR